MQFKYLVSFTQNFERKLCEQQYKQKYKALLNFQIIIIIKIYYKDKILRD